MLNERASGILVHLSSLPGPFGIGDMDSACFFLDFLEASGQKFWQFLPTGPGCDVFGNSPYMNLSAFAGNPLFISPRLLFEKGLVQKHDLEKCPLVSEYTVDFRVVESFKNSLLEEAFIQFESHELYHDDFSKFCNTQSWLDDFALFMSLREKFNQKPWYEWPRKIALHDKKALQVENDELRERVRYYKFVQFVFFEQWKRMRQAAVKKGIRLIGDIPIYVGHDSADVWGNQSCFDLDSRTLMPCSVAGVPPDYFSDTGQRWGNPLYRWTKGRKPNEALYKWWCQRFAQIGSMVDVVRIDHFRGFASYWQIPAKEETAIKGKWVKGPGLGFFERVKKDIEHLSIIAEDLGVITPEVEELRDKLGFPGMKILQFAFDSDDKNAYLPHNFDTVNCVVYTGTHDNDTTRGWYYDESVSMASRDRARRYANCDGSVIHKDFIRLAMSSVANIAIIPLQDVLGFGGDCRMNMPSSAEGNWVWRCAQRFFDNDVKNYLRDESQFYGRIGD